MITKAFALIAVLAAPVVALADDQTPSKDTTKDTYKDTSKEKTKAGKLSDADLQVLAHAHHLDQVEVDLGKLAQKRGSTQAVKDYGTMLVKDHGQNDKDLMAFAKKHGQTIPKEQATNEAEKKEMKDAKDMADKLHTLKGADFDKQFLLMMVNDHEKELAKIDTQIGMTTDSDLGQMLRDTKPVLQRHADQARDLMKNEPQAMGEEQKDRDQNPNVRK